VSDRGVLTRNLALLLILLGFGLRVFGLGAQELRGDEGFSFIFARRSLVEIVPALLRQGDPHPPLHYLLLHGWMALAGTSEFSMRYISLMAGVLLVPLMFRLGCCLDGAETGLLLAGLVAISESLVWLGQDVRNQYTLAMLFATLAALLLARATRRSTWHTWVLYSVTCALTVHSHYYGVFALLTHGLYLLLGSARGKTWLAWMGSSLAAVATLLPWLMAVWPRLSVQQLQDPAHPNLVPYLTSIGVELTVGQAFGQSGGRWLFLGALILCLVGAAALFKQRPAWAALLVAWLGGAALGIYVVLFTRATFNAFYISVAAPAWWALVGVGVMSLWQRRRRGQHVVAVLSGIGLVGSVLVSLLHYYTDPAYNRTNGYRGVAAHIAAETTPGDLFLAHFPDPVWDYYLKDNPTPRTMQPASAQVSVQETERALSELAAQYERLWFVPYHHSVWDPEDVVYRWLDSHSLLEQEAVYCHLTLLAYRPAHTLDRVMTPLSVSLGDQLQLEGTFVTVNGMPVDLDTSFEIPPAAKVNVTLLWRALTDVSEGYTVFVHLLGDHGRLISQHDGWPVAGTRPTFTWSPDEQLLDRHEMVVPSEVSVSGGTLLVGMYHSDTLERQLFEGGRDAIRLADVKLD
jgi:hypothetical protein